MSSNDHHNASEFQIRYWREVWLRLAETYADRPIALYGAGWHTHRLLAAVADIEPRPSVAVIIDDAPRSDDVADIPVRKPGAVDPSPYAAVLISSDTVEERLRRRAEAWIAELPEGERPRIECLYHRLPNDTMDFGWDAVPADRGRAVRRGFVDGQRELIDQWGNVEIEPRTERANRPPCAIDPVHHWIVRMETPAFTVHVRPIKREVSSMFKPHQIYPGSEHRPPGDMFTENFVTRREPGLIMPDTRVAVIGSCFAITFRNWLIANDYNFMQYEDGPLADCGSVRSGPVFNSGSLRQIFEWAADGFVADEPYWRLNGMLYDPYRKYICWPDEASAEAERASHFAAVRTMLGDSDVLIMTLGLSEVWRNARDKRCFYLIPPPDVFDASMHEHALLSADENLENLERVYEVIRAVNPKLRIVVTLSPVPLMATYFDRHVVVSDTVSKASLRTALHFFCAHHPEVIYFPSYELLMRRPEWPFATDNRHIRARPYVQRIMETFIAHFGPPRSSRPGAPAEGKAALPSYYAWAQRR